MAGERFVDFAEIDPVYCRPSYYLLPDAYLAICEAMKRRKRAAIGRLVLSCRERLVAINPDKDMMLLTRLRDAREIAPLDVSLAVEGEGP